MLRVISVIAAADVAGADGVLVDKVCLPHDLRYLRRKLLHLQNGGMVMLDLPQAVMLADGDHLQVENGERIAIEAAVEKLYAVSAKTPLHLIELAWHLGNRHLPAQIEENRILLTRDPVIRNMLQGLGAKVVDVEETFHPQRGAYHAHGH